MSTNGMSDAEFVARLPQRELHQPTVDEWLERHRTSATALRIDVVAALDASRAEYADDGRRG